MAVHDYTHDYSHALVGQRGVVGARPSSVRCSSSHGSLHSQGISQKLQSQLEILEEFEDFDIVGDLAPGALINAVQESPI